MTEIPAHLLTFFRDLHCGDELVLHKGPGATNWKIHLSVSVPRGAHIPLPLSVWQSTFSGLPEEWVGTIRFFCVSGPPGSLTSFLPWRATITTSPPVELRRGMVGVIEHPE
jgi:hypothetical protein